jgi:hypothetical protein
LAQQRFFAALIVDLVNEYVPGPARIAGHAQIKFPIEPVLTVLQNGRVAAPAFNFLPLHDYAADVRLQANQFHDDRFEGS